MSDANSRKSNKKPNKNSITVSKVTDALTKHLKCPITHELMVDPVTAKDGHTYERTAIERWLDCNPNSPLDPSKEIEIQDLVAVRTVQQSIETLIELGAVDEKLCDEWKEKKKEIDLLKAQKLNRKALAYYIGIGVDKDTSKAISLFEQAAEKGCAASMFWLGKIYTSGGNELHIDFLQKAASWYEKGATAGDEDCMLKVGKCYYNGKGVGRNLAVARKWFVKASKDEDSVPESMFWLGKMMMRGEGGSRNIAQGLTLINDSASKGYSGGEKMIKVFLETLDSHIDDDAD